MTQTVDPVTQQHIERAAERLAEEFAGAFSRRRSRDTWRSRPTCSARLESTCSCPFSPTASPASGCKALAQAEGLTTKEMPEVLFVCVQNAGRSQMAAGLRQLPTEGRVHVRSAGSAPAEAVNPLVVEALSEVGVDLDEAFPKPLTDEVVRAADVVITMGCGTRARSTRASATRTGRGRPCRDRPRGVRAIRDEIDRRVTALAAELSDD